MSLRKAVSLGEVKRLNKFFVIAFLLIGGIATCFSITYGLHEHSLTGLVAGAGGASYLISVLFLLIKTHKSRLRSLINLLIYTTGFTFLAIGVCWGTIIPLFHVLFLLFLILSAIFFRFRELNYFLKTSLFIFLLLSIKILPICKESIPPLDNGNLLITNSIYITIIIFLLTLLLNHKKYMSLFHFLYEDNAELFIIQGAFTYSILHFVKNVLTHDSIDRDTTANLKECLMQSLKKLYIPIKSTTEIVEIIEKLNKFINSIYPQRKIYIDPKHCTKHELRIPLLHGLITSILFELLLNAYKHSAPLKGEIGFIKLKCTAKKICICIKNKTPQTHLSQKRNTTKLGTKLNKILLSLTFNAKLTTRVSKNQHMTKLCFPI